MQRQLRFEALGTNGRQIDKQEHIIHLSKQAIIMESMAIYSVVIPLMLFLYSCA